MSGPYGWRGIVLMVGGRRRVEAGPGNTAAGEMGSAPGLHSSVLAKKLSIACLHSSWRRNTLLFVCMGER